MTVDAPTRIEPSAYQTRIYDFVEQGQGNGVVDAVPGSGKTTTLIGAANHIDGENNLFVAFNKSIATEIGNRLQRQALPMRAATIHSTGFAALRSMHTRWEVDDRKTIRLAREIIPGAYSDNAAPLAQLIGLSRLTRRPLNSTLDVEQLCDDYNIELMWGLESGNEPTTLRLARDVMERGDELARRNRIIDYNDMVCLPVEWSLPIPKHDNVFVDECQDLNAAQLEFVLRCVSGTGRMLFVGDKRQAIYGFAGADTTSIPNIIDRTKATVLPLSICYRCPTTHIKLAAAIYPGIEPAPWAIPGEIVSMDGEQMFKNAQVGDMILCRITRPLVAACLNFIRNGVPARVRGRDIGKQLTNIVRQTAKLLKAPQTFNDFYGALMEYKYTTIEAKRRRDASDIEIQSLEDRVMSVATIYESTYRHCHSPADLEREIEALFSDEQTGVTLSTVHKAKGLEAERVFIMQPDLMPHPKAKTQWEIEQEWNIRYVALTRSKRFLAFVQMPEE